MTHSVEIFIQKALMRHLSGPYLLSAGTAWWTLGTGRLRLLLFDSISCVEIGNHLHSRSWSTPRLADHNLDQGEVCGSQPGDQRVGEQPPEGRQGTLLLRRLQVPIFFTIKPRRWFHRNGWKINIVLQLTFFLSPIKFMPWRKAQKE